MTETSSQKRRRNRRSAKTMGEQVRDVLIGPVGALILVGGIGGFAWFRQQDSRTSFETNVQQGQSALAAVKSFEDLGRQHVEPGQPVNYDNEFPTSGPHDPVPVTPGVYSEVQRPEMLVHSLEHGNIVIYYDEPTSEVMARLRNWAAQFPGAWDGVVVVPKEGLGESIVMTAWTKKLRLDAFDPAAAAAFIDAYRGRGPENPVR